MGSSSTASDIIPLLAVAETKMDIVSSKGSREVSVKEFINLKDKMKLRPGEILKSIFIPSTS